MFSVLPMYFLSESWCDINQKDPSLLPSFSGIQHVKIGRGLGLSYFRDHNTVVRADNFSNMQKIYLNELKCSIVLVYRMPRLQTEEFLKQLDMVRDEDEKVVLGDFYYT